MARPRSYAVPTVLTAARDVFWRKGYEGASITDLEEGTGLNRSSLYTAFGGKRALFDAALRLYLDSEIAARLGPLEAPGAGHADVVRFFTGFAEALRRLPSGPSPGCLLVNTTVELAAADEGAAAVAAGYRDRLRAAFTGALGGPAGDAHPPTDTDSAPEAEPDLRRDRGWHLAATVMGVFVTARIDAADAADLCDAVARDVATWSRTRG